MAFEIYFNEKSPTAKALAQMLDKANIPFKTKHINQVSEERIQNTEWLQREFPVLYHPSSGNAFIGESALNYAAKMIEEMQDDRIKKISNHFAGSQSVSVGYTSNIKDTNWANPFASGGSTLGSSIMDDNFDINKGEQTDTPAINDKGRATFQVHQFVPKLLPHDPTRKISLDEHKQIVERYMKERERQNSMRPDLQQNDSVINPPNTNEKPKVVRKRLVKKQNKQIGQQHLDFTNNKQPIQVSQQHAAQFVQQPVRLVQQPTQISQQPVRLIQQPVQLVQQPVRLIQSQSGYPQIQNYQTQNPIAHVQSVHTPQIVRHY